MKTLHKPNLYCWSQFDEQRNIDFHSYLWVRAQGNIMFDPLPLSAHDKQHLNDLGKLTHIIITNSDHVRAAEQLSLETGAAIYGPAAQKDDFPIVCVHWLSEAKNLEDGLDVYCLDGSKTPGELAFVVEGDTLITGDLIRAHAGGTLCMLPTAKLQDVSLAINSVKRLAAIAGITAILPGDGWPIFREGEAVLQALVKAM